jgi:arginine:agmatine antiporter
LDQPQAAPEAAKLGPFLATALVAGNLVGSGIYLLPATLAAVGGISLAGWALATTAALLMAVVFSALAVLRPDLDGIPAYVRATLGPFLGFQAGLVYWASNWTGIVAVAVTVTGYLAFFLPGLKDPLVGAGVSLAVVWLMVLANIVSTRFAGKLGGVSLALGLLPLIGVGLFGWLWFDPHLYARGWNPGGKPLLSAVGASLVLIFWAFTGMESAIVAAAVVRRPARNVPIATVGGTALAALIYVLASTAIAGIVPAAELQRSSAPFASAMTRMLGPIAASLVAICALVKVAGTGLGITLITGETTRASAASGHFPRLFARIRPDGVPVNALLLLGAIMSVLVVVTISPTLGRQFEVMIDVSTIFTLVPYIGCALAAARLARAITARGPRLMVQACALLAAVFCAWFIAASEPRLLLISVAALTATIPLWLAVRAASRTQTPATSPAGKAI